jgi:hypothetical protein
MTSGTYMSHLKIAFLSLFGYQFPTSSPCSHLHWSFSTSGYLRGRGGQFSRWRCSRKRLSVCSVLRCRDLWLQCSVCFVHSLELLVAHTESLFMLRRHLGNWPGSKHEKQIAGSAWETWIVDAADGVRFTRVRWEIDFLLTFETAPFFCERTAYFTDVYLCYVFMLIYMLGFFMIVSLVMAYLSRYM